MTHEEEANINDEGLTLTNSQGNMEPELEQTTVLKQKYKQLALSWADDFAISPKDIFNAPEKLYIPKEIIKYPFFLQERSKIVEKSRLGYFKDQMEKKLVKQGKNREEIKSAINKKYKKQSEDTLPSDLRYETKEWTIVGSYFYGLPDEFDGHVWDIIMNIASDLYLKMGKFYTVYYITDAMILNELISRGVFSSKGGRQRARIKESLERLSNTKYIHSKGSFRKDINTYVSTENYDFSLISGKYSRGEQLPDGSTAYRSAIVLDPILVLNMSHNHFFILSNKNRNLIKRYGAKVLSDKLYYWGLIDHNQNVINQFDTYGVKPHKVVGYNTICTHLGITPLTGIPYKKSGIETQLKDYHEELLALGYIEEVLIDEYKKAGVKSFNLIYIYGDKFIHRDIAQFESKKTKIQRKVSEDLKIQITNESSKGFFAKLKSLVREKDNLHKLMHMPV